MARLKMIQDRIDHMKFVYDTGKLISEKILHSDSENQKFIDLTIEVAKMCEEYPENEYGMPCAIDIMSEAFRHVNYALGNIKASGGEHIK